MRFKKWLKESEEAAEVPYWYHWKGEQNPIPQWAQHIPTYHRGLITMDKRYPGFLDVNPPEFYAQPNHHVWHTPDGELAYSLIPHDGKNEISGVYNLGGSKKRPGHAKYAVRRGFIQGGNLLHAFEGDDKFSLPHYYHNAVGAMPSAYYPFDPKLAHKDWNYEKYGTPGLVRLEIPPEAHQDIDRWLRTDHAELSRDEFQDRLNHLKRMALGSKMENSQPIKKKGGISREYDRLVSGAEEHFFGDYNPAADEIKRMAQEWGVSLEEAAERLREQHDI